LHGQGEFVLGNVGLCTVDEEMVNTGYLGLPMNGEAKLVGVQHGVLGHRFEP